MLKNLLIAGAVMFSAAGFAGDIAFGKVVGTKVYSFNDNKSVKVYFELAAKSSTPGCKEQGKPFGIITYSKKTEASVSHMLSVILAAQISGKQIRIYSQTDNSCEIDLVALQESYY
ncbi:hypothetical protein [Pseudoalteromonas luteoviolacea]|uniref:Uncharacterized protein n=1 Tax=Pseudoalteromonas luteoviolacea S4054 TaxID=1129367 RepID=A0A0F6A5T0_9GAMM|nr:hypothetical protein [Pseudoalteromonas luteoviolacea]AOT07665.1 hypothetical protein S4054249_07325 [Pseudoalteromonas luteoviolacea]AOT12581.1 hypothetical protein S40542_07325 [Pseudoalteromonas luteoviolacea]AOT17495.1 hypothetical protein S4054_07325 [Pseudoalteromonas luteoviolacea]KKE81201.1 hypothetical protein N479_23250 [Pseudoalteromonas luteoviolacea S4054]KZN66329.1 hypothetical protein N481_24345 [Pseudoalteromonas luteoviolacea S4047-1]